MPHARASRTESSTIGSCERRRSVATESRSRAATTKSISAVWTSGDVCRSRGVHHGAANQVALREAPEGVDGRKAHVHVGIVHQRIEQSRHDLAARLLDLTGPATPFSRSLADCCCMSDSVTS